MLAPERLDAVYELCHLLMWDSPALAERCFVTFKASIDEDDEWLSIVEPLRTALRPITSFRDWNELDLIVEDLLRLIKMRRLPIRLDKARDAEEDDEDQDDDSFNVEDPDEFVAQVNDVLTDYGFNLWCWETESSAFCVFIARDEDRERIYHLAYTLGFFDDSGAEMRCCAEVG